MNEQLDKEIERINNKFEESISEFINVSAIDEGTFQKVTDSLRDNIEQLGK